MDLIGPLHTPVGKSSDSLPWLSAGMKVLPTVAHAVDRRCFSHALPEPRPQAGLTVTALHLQRG